MRLPFSDFTGRIRAAIRPVVINSVYRTAGAILLIVTILSGLILWQYWTNISKETQARSGTLAYLLAEQTTRTFQAVDLTLAGLDAVFSASLMSNHSPAFERLLAQRVRELDFIHALYVVGPAGRVTQTSGEVQDVVSDLSAQPYFDAFQRDPTLHFLIGQPLFSQPGVLTAIPVVRRLETLDGSFGGMIVASVEPKYFRDFYRNLDLGRRGSIDLYQDNGSILLASTEPDTMTLVPPVALRLPTFNLDAQLGLFRTRSGSADQQLVAYHRAQGYPLVVAVGVDIKDLRSRWWRIAAPAMAATAVAVVLGMALAVLIVRRLEERRQAQNRAMMMQKLEALGQMTASISHDFRNLLAVMHSTIRLIRKQGPTERILSAAEEAIERGSGLVTQLLAFSRRQVLEVRPVDINRLLSDLHQVLGHAAGPDVTVRIETVPNLPACRADQTQFDAALMNLVVNARQAMPGGGTINIATRLLPATVGERETFAEVSVADTGCGIAAGDVKRIFEPFFTTKAETGTGLGLAQVYGFMQQIGGDVKVDSKIGAGTTFRLLFPIDAAETMQAGSPRQKPPLGGTAMRPERAAAPD